MMLVKRCSRWPLSAVAVAVLAGTGCEQAGDRPATTAIPVGATELLEDDPTLSIGTDTSGLTYFQSVSGVVQLDSGRIAVADMDLNTVRIYSAEGAVIEQFGGAGSGPGEFLALAGIWKTGSETLLAWDVPSNRISEWHTDGILLQATAVPIGFFPVPLGTFQDGSLLAVRKGGQAPGTLGSVQEIRGQLYRIPIDGSSPEVLLEVPWERVAAGADSRGGDKLMYVPQPYGAKTQVVVADTSFFVSDASDWTINEFSWSGAEMRTITLNRELTQIADDVKAAWVEEGVESRPMAYRRGVRRLLESLSWPVHKPTIDDLMLDTSGRIWFREFTPYGAERAIWGVLDDAGNVLATGSIPAEFTPHVITEEHLVGVRPDGMDVQWVHAYPLRDSVRALLHGG